MGESETEGKRKRKRKRVTAVNEQRKSAIGGVSETELSLGMNT